MTLLVFLVLVGGIVWIVAEMWPTFSQPERESFMRAGLFLCVVTAGLLYVSMMAGLIIRLFGLVRG